MDTFIYQYPCIMDSISIDIKVSGHFWILEKSIFLVISQKNDTQYPLVSRYPWTLGYMDIWIVGRPKSFSIQILGYLNISALPNGWKVGYFNFFSWILGQPKIPGYPSILISNYPDTTSLYIRNRAESISSQSEHYTEKIYVVQQQIIKPFLFIDSILIAPLASYF